MAKADDSWTDWLRSVLAEYERPLVRYACRLTGDLETARDVVQDTFLALCRQGPDSADRPIAAWLFRVCRNRAFDVIKGRHPDCPVDDVPGLSSQSSGPAELLEQREKLDLILECLGQLPQNQREVIALKFQHGLSYKEISSVTQLSVTNVGFLIHVGLKTIREQLSTEAPPKARVLRRIR